MKNVAFGLLVALAMSGALAFGSISGPATAPSSAPAPSGALLEWRRTGGFAGTDDTLTVRADGSYKIAGRLLGAHEGRLDSNALAALTVAIQAAKITGDARYQPSGPTADTFHYTLRTGGHTVRWEDTAKVPAELGALAREVSEILDKAREHRKTK